VTGHPDTEFDSRSVGTKRGRRRGPQHLLGPAGRTVILTTHDMEEADALADRVAVLADGRLRAVGTPLALKTALGTG